MTLSVPRPAADEYSPYYDTYISKVPTDSDPALELTAQLESVPALLAGVTESRAGYRYAPEKWSIKEVIGHLSDSERVFGYRMLRIARADTTPLPGFDENEFMKKAGFDSRTLKDLLAEFIAVRASTLALVRSMDPEAWERRGTANGKTISTRALLYITPGHVTHHMGTLRTRYGVEEMARARA
ncbi:MAG TPA: DinB family protein [Gemmatimonadales bacterium]|nr:DinB family protein [Gemmatimonadales bacterium]